MSGRRPEWQLYERLVARMMVDQAPPNLCVTPNARIMGRISKRSRQIDVVLDLRHASDNSRRIIVDAKRRTRKIGVTDVEAFRGLMVDVNATHGYLVCPEGHTSAAERRAQSAVTIRLLPLDRLENFDPSTWPKCTSAACSHGRVFWDGYPEMSLDVRPASMCASVAVARIAFVHYVGKCDRCGRFYAKCMTCGDMMAPPDDDDEDYGIQCRCKLPWFWLASIEDADDGELSAELHVILMHRKGTVITVDRRPASQYHKKRRKGH